MEFKSKTSLDEHFKMLEKEGWVIPEWIVKEEDGRTRGTKMFKINFDKVKKNE